MSKKDILSDYFNTCYKSNKIKSHPNSKKKNYLTKYDIYNTENNILKFTPKAIKITNRNIINIQPYTFYEKKNSLKNQKNTERYQNLSKTKTSNSLYSINNIVTTNDISLNLINEKNTDIIPFNKEIYQNKTYSTNFNSSGNLINKKIQMLSNKNKQKVKSVLSINLKNKIQNKIDIDEEVDKIVNYYMTMDLVDFRKINIDNKCNEINKIEKVKNNIQSKYILDKKLLKMNNIRHKLITGNLSDFKSLNIQKRTLGKEKHRDNLLQSIGDYYTKRPYKTLNKYIIDKKYISKYDTDNITNNFKFNNYKGKFVLSEKIKKTINLRNRIKKISDFYLLDKVKLNINKTKYMNFYENMNYLSERVKSTEGVIRKKIEIRKKYKDNITNLFIV